MGKLKILPLLLSVCMLLFWGCNQAPGTGSDCDTTTATPAEEPPTGLTPAPENTARCAITSAGEMAETESGYYLLTNGLLYYADKSDLSGLMSWLWS